jgi:hypothetical protein
MRNFLAWGTSTIGIYAILSYIWTYLEELEHGRAIVTKVDTIICFIISVFIAAILTAGIGYE